jgi:glycogen debranching enzyme
MKDYEKAEAELTKLAEANLRELDGHGFNEWLDGKTGEPKGEPYQGWSAGTYIYAYHCLKKKKALFF